MGHLIHHFALVRSLPGGTRLSPSLSFVDRTRISVMDTLARTSPISSGRQGGPVRPGASHLWTFETSSGLSRPIGVRVPRDRSDPVVRATAIGSGLGHHVPRRIGRADEGEDPDPFQPSVETARDAHHTTSRVNTPYQTPGLGRAPQRGDLGLPRTARRLPCEARCRLGEQDATAPFAGGS